MSAQNTGDPIANLPSDAEEPTPQELQVRQTLFRDAPKTASTLFSEFAGVLIVGALFAILSLPIVDSLIARFVPSVGNSPVLRILVKTFIFIIIYYFIKNMYLVRK